MATNKKRGIPIDTNGSRKSNSKIEKKTSDAKNQAKNAGVIDDNDDR